MPVDKYGWAIQKSLFARTSQDLHFLTPVIIQKCLT